MSDKPKTWEEFEGEYKNWHRYASKYIAKEAWNARDELAKEEIAKVQAEIEKRDALVRECLEQEKMDYGMSESDAIHFRMRKVFAILKYDYTKLTQGSK